MNKKLTVIVHLIVISGFVFSLVIPEPSRAQAELPPEPPTPTVEPPLEPTPTAAPSPKPAPTQEALLEAILPGDAPDRCASDDPAKVEACSGAVPLAVDTTQYVSSGSPLTFYVRDDTSTAVFYNGVRQFYGDYAEGVFLWVNNNVYGPGTVPAGLTTHAYTLISNTTQGTGTYVDPWVVTTRVAVGATGLKLEQKVTYKNGESYLTFSWKVENSTGLPISYVLFHAADLYTQGNDVGYGYYNQQTNSIGGYNSSRTFYQYFRPLTPPSHYFEGMYFVVWERIGSTSGIGAGFNDTYLDSSLTDNGAGLQWNRTAPSYSHDQVSDYLVFNTEGSLGPLLVPGVLTFGTVSGENYLTVHPTNPTDAWTLSENLSWLSLSSYNGTGDATVVVKVDRGGLAPGNYSGAINAVSGSRTASASVTMRVALPQVEIVSPSVNSAYYQGGSMLVKANVTLEGNPALGLNVYGNYAPAGFEFALHDDGSHADGLANDGVYANQITLPGGQILGNNFNDVNLTLYANASGAIGSSSVTFDILPAAGVPTVTVLSINPPIQIGFQPTAGDLYKGQELTFLVGLSYNDNSIHNDALVTMIVTDPTTLALQRYNFAFSGIDNQFVLKKTFSAGGLFHLDFQAQVPTFSGFADGWSYLPLEIYEADLALNASLPASLYNQYALVPIEACVTASGVAVEGAEVTAQVMPDNKSVLLQSKPDAPGCYQNVFAPETTGSRTVSFAARKIGYKPATGSRSFSVVPVANNLITIINDFTTGAVRESGWVAYYTNLIAEAGDFYKGKLVEDTETLIVDTAFDLFAIISYNNGTDKVKTYFKSGHYLKPLNNPKTLAMLQGKYLDEVKLTLYRNASVGLLSSTAEAMETLAIPSYYFSTSGDFTKGRSSDLRSYIHRQYEEILSDPVGLSEKFNGVLSKHALEMQGQIQKTADQARASSSGFTADQIKAFFLDFAYRGAANVYFGSQDLKYRSDLLLISRASREASDNDLNRKIILFWSEFGLKVAANYLLGPAGGLITNLGLGAYHAAINSKNIADDQKFRDQAVNLLSQAFYAHEFVAGNTLTGLFNVIDRKVPNTPLVKIISTDDVRTQSAFFTKDLYTDVTIQNTGSVQADFGVLTFYNAGMEDWIGFNSEHNAVADDVVNLSSGENVRTVSLQPGQSQVLRVYYKHGSSDYGAPNKNGYAMIAFAYSADSVFVTDTKYVAPFSPRTVQLAPTLVSEAAEVYDVSLKVAAQPNTGLAPTEYQPLAPSVMQETMDPFAIFPIRASIHSNPGQIYDTYVLGVDNPFPSPLAVRITQVPLLHSTITDYHAGRLENGRITWYRVLEPHEHITLEYDFYYRGGYGASVNMPSTALSYYDPSNNTDVVLNSGEVAFIPSHPVMGSASGPVSAKPSEALVITAQVKNLATSYSWPVAVRLTIYDESGKLVVGPILKQATVSPLTTQDFTFNYTAPKKTGIYYQEVQLIYAYGKIILKADLLSILPKKVFLPAILKK